MRCELTSHFVSGAVVYLTGGPRLDVLAARFVGTTVRFGPNLHSGYVKTEPRREGQRQRTPIMFFLIHGDRSAMTTATTIEVMPSVRK